MLDGYEPISTVELLSVCPVAALNLAFRLRVPDLDFAVFNTEIL